MIQTAYEQGVRRIALTSHYSTDMPLDSFLRDREAAFLRLQNAMEHHPKLEGLQLKLGAEVLYSPNLAFIPAQQLCLEGTNLLLLEFAGDEIPFRLETTVSALLAQGIEPLLAHIERYSFVMKDPRWLYRWVCAGGYAQINAASLRRTNRSSDLLEKLILWELVHVVSSDAHSPQHRPPNLEEGMQLVHGRLGQVMAEKLERQAELLFCGESLELRMLHEPKKLFGKWN